MGTSNFHNVNANSIYVIDPQDEFEYEDTLEYINELFIEADKEGKFEFASDDEVTLDTELRSFPAKSIGIVYESFEFLGVGFEVQLIPLVRNGYYEAGNLDYEIKYYVDSSTEAYNIDDLVYDFQKYPEDFDVNAGLAKIHGDNLKKRLQNLEDKLTGEVEDIFTKCSDQYRVQAQFSNRETWYEKVS